MSTNAKSIAISRLPWPLYTIDFEASSLANGYPIEVGLCRWQSPEHPLEGWATLIQPTPQWITDLEWNEQSAAIHRIDFAELSDGTTPTETIRSLNTLLQGHASWCDGGPFDLGWARTLAAASDVRPALRIGDWDLLSGALDQAGYERMARWLDRSTIPHRARADAERLMQALAVGLGISGLPIVDLVNG